MRSTATRLTIGLVAFALLLGAAVWYCERDPAILFLPHGCGGEWIRFPAAPAAILHHPAAVPSQFRKLFVLNSLPRTARVCICAAKKFDLYINGKRMESGAVANWKQPSEMNVLSALVAGTNAIQVLVTSDNSPAMLCLDLRWEGGDLRTDQNWVVSCGDSPWRSAWLAEESLFPGSGNLIGGGERTAEAIASVWPVWALFVVAALGVGWLLQKAAAAGIGLARRQILVVVVFGSVWLVMFVHNAPLLPAVLGFDARYHAEYISYLMYHWRVPYANEGLEMYQPPLYYAICAAGLRLSGMTAPEQAPLFFRMLGMMIGAAHCTFIFLSLKLLLPGRDGAQRAGLTLAAFVPMHLYLCHYTTNETLTATLAAATMYCCLRVIAAPRPRPLPYAVLGLCLGAAMLTKMTNLLLAPVVLIAVCWKLVRERSSWRTWLTTAGVGAAVSFLVAGWFYVRVWQHFGTPLVGAWDVASGFAWWQDPGFHTGADFFGWGRSLTDPLFSGFGGIWDGLYSTFWGDGLCGGTGDMVLRPAWNYTYMTAGYALALVPTALILCGAAVAVARCIGGCHIGFGMVVSHGGTLSEKESSTRRPAWFVPLAFFGFLGCALAYMSLKVPAYGQVKSIYCSGVLLTLCLFCAEGWLVVTRQWRWSAPLTGALLAAWAMNSVVAMWVPSHSAAVHFLPGARLAMQNNTNAMLAEFSAAVAIDPKNSQARRLLASALSKCGRQAEATTEAMRAVELEPTDAAARVQLGQLLARRGQMDQAIAEAERAVASGPEYALSHQSLCSWLESEGHYDRAIAAARAGLAVWPLDATLQYELGSVLDKTGDRAAASRHLRYAVLLAPEREETHRALGMALIHSGNIANGLAQLDAAIGYAPNSAPLLDEVGWVLATCPDPRVRNGRGAVNLAERACALTSDSNPKMLSTLAAAYAEAGDLGSARVAWDKAMTLATSAADHRIVQRLRVMKERFDSGEAYRE